MKKRACISSLMFATSALAFAALAPACSGGSSPVGFPGSSGGNGNGNGNNGGSSGGHDGGSASGGPSPGLGGNVNNDSGSGPGATGGDGGLVGCATATATATAKTQPVAMEFVLDGSGSMNQNSKWTAATGALTSIFNTWAGLNDPGLYAGLVVFSDQNDPSGGSGPYPSTGVDVPIAQVNTTQATALENRYTANGDGPSGGTPTGSALTGGYSVIEGFTSATNAKKVLILLTDGVPTDNCSPGIGSNYPSNPCVVQAAAELAKAAPAGPIETFAIGIGVVPDIDPSFLGYLAQKGGSGPAGCNPTDPTTGAADLCYFQVDPSGSSSATQTAFENAINAIRGKVVSISCTFALNLQADAGILDPSKVNVTVNGVTVPQDPTNGWTYDNPANPTSVTLHGTSCANVTATQTATVSIVLGCATIVPPPPK